MIHFSPIGTILLSPVHPPNKQQNDDNKIFRRENFMMDDTKYASDSHTKFYDKKNGITQFLFHPKKKEQ